MKSLEFCPNRKTTARVNKNNVTIYFNKINQNSVDLENGFSLADSDSFPLQSSSKEGKTIHGKQHTF